MKRIRDSLTAKIFLLTTGLLVLISMITYGSVACFLPHTYRNELEENLRRVSEEMREELKRYGSLEEAQNFLDLFSANNQASVTLLNEEGDIVFPEFVSAEMLTETAVEESAAVSGVTLHSIITQEDSVDSLTQTGQATADVVERQEDYYALAGSFRDGSATKTYQVTVGKETYTMLVAGTMQSVSQTMEILREILPMILVIALFAALICALGASLYLTRPVMGLSRVSRKMAALQFDEKCRENRTDEVGILARSLNELSENLSGALADLREANAQLKSDMEKEREAERKRTAFFAAASHELKTPVTILKGHLEGMVKNMGAYRNRDFYLERCRKVTATMEGMVREILTVSRMESGAWEVKREEADLPELVRLQIAGVMELLEEREMKLQIQMPEHLGWSVDSSMMEKVFRNLLVNAIRYSPPCSEIRIFMGTRREMLCFYMENTGIHIPEESLPCLFDAFYRVEDSRNRKSGGSGLGLYIVRMILEQHGGVCGAENSREGVRIWFRLGK